MSTASPTSSGGAPESVRRFHLAVDDGGEFLVAAGARLTIGHVSNVPCDLPFLADVEREHAVIELHASFHGGHAWRLRAVHERARIRVRGLDVASESVELVDGDPVELARNLGCIFRAPDPASSSALLELARGADCLGSARVLLLAPGAAGRVRIGSRRSRLVPVANLEHEVSFELRGAALRVACAGGLACGDRRVAAAPDAALEVSLPARATSFVVTGARTGGGAPFTLGFLPTDAGDSTGRGGRT